MYQGVATVRRCEAVNSFVHIVELVLEEAVDYIPGQYLMVNMGEGDQRPFSIASIPAHGKEVTLHIGASPDNPYAWEVLERIQRERAISVSLPHGNAGYEPTRSRPLLLIAGGTGFSYAWSILQAHLARTETQPVLLYWGVREEADLYYHEALVEMAKRFANLTYVPVVERPQDENWAGPRGKVLDVVIDDLSATTSAAAEGMKAYDVYIAGRFDMVRVARDQFTALGLPKDQLFGDALSFI